MTPHRDEFLRILLRHLPAVTDGAPPPGDINLRTLGLNSMRAVDLVVDLEEGLDVAFPDEAFTDDAFATSDGLWAVVGPLLPVTAQA